MDVQLLQMPYRGERNSPIISTAPNFVDDKELHQRLDKYAYQVLASAVVALPPDEEKRCGDWQRVAVANRQLANKVAQAVSNNVLPIGLLANCNALMGMLGGLQLAHLENASHTVGLIWIDAHADFNTPETTLSGMLGGMPVACSAGLCLHNLREIAGMSEPISTKHIVMCGLRDVDPLEQSLLDEHHIEQIALDDLATSEKIAQLGNATDAIYVHVDMDVLDPAEVPGHPLTVPGGPSSKHLAGLLHDLFKAAPSIEALGIASIPPPNAKDVTTIEKIAAQRLICAAVQGVTDANYIKPQL